MHSIRSNELYVKRADGRVVSKIERDSVMHLIKLLFRLNIVSTDQAIQIALLFEIFFV